MTNTAFVFLALAGSAAVVDWWAVAGKRHDPELIAKPLTLVLLIATAVSIEPATTSVQAWFVVALGLSLAGDVFLMLKRDMFIAGLGSFLLAHIAYIVGFLQVSLGLMALVGAAIALIGIATFGRRIYRSAAADDRRLALPVAVYIGVISLMLVAAYATGNALAIVGASFFLASDAILGWNRFVKSITSGRVLTMITYHTAQILLVLALLSL